MYNALPVLMAHNEQAAISRDHHERLSVVAQIPSTEGPMYSIVALSQGTVIAGFIASLLQGHSRRLAFEMAQMHDAATLPFPDMFQSLDHPPLKFMVLYGPTISTRRKCVGYHQATVISTPVWHVLGQ